MNRRPDASIPVPACIDSRGGYADSSDVRESPADRRDMHSRLLRLEKKAREEGHLMLAHLIGVAALEAQHADAAAPSGADKARPGVAKRY